VVCHISLESSWRYLQLCFTLHLYQRYAHKVMGFQICKSPNLKKIRDSNLGVLGQNGIWVLAPWPSTNNIIRRKVVASPKSKLWWVIRIHVCPWFICAPKVFEQCTNQLVFGLCMSMWIIDLLVTHLNPHLRARVCPSTLEVLWTKKRAPTPYPFIVFTFGLVVESIHEFRGASTSFPLGLRFVDWASLYLGEHILT
jgi:hypothetical protein